MKPRFYPLWIFIIVAALWHPVLNLFGGEILYEDDFTNLDPSWGTPGDILSVKDRKLVLKPALNTTQSVLNQSNVFGDADIEVEVNLSAGDPVVAGGLIFWAKDYTNFYCLCLNANGFFKISHFVIDRWLNPVGWTASDAINKGIGQVNKLRVVTKLRQATAYINDKQVITINGQPPQGGGCVGVSGGSAQESQNTWQFANLRVIATASAAASSPASSPSRPSRQIVLRLHGSNTIGNELAPALCEDFLKYQGAISVQRKPGSKEDEVDIEGILPGESANPVTIEIQSHGSSTAFEDLASGRCDLGMSSRKIKQDEASRCASAGLGNLSSPACENVLGLDGIAVLVPKNNPASGLAKEQLADIFSGKISDWSQVGGPPGPIYLYAPDEKSGTFDTFRTIILGSRSISPRASRFENSAKLSDAIAADSNAIGFAGNSFVRNCKVLAILDAGGKPQLPTTFAVSDGEYPLSRRLYLYAPEGTQNEWARKFVDFARPKMEVFSWWTSGGEAAALNALFENYEKQYPGVGIINATVAGGSGTGARPVLQTRLAVNNPPDTWQSHPGWELLGQYVRPGYCEAITELYQSAGWEKAFPKALVNLVSQNGNAYAVLTGVHHGNVLWYNKKLLEKNGIKVGENMTFDEFFAICEKLKSIGIPAIGVGDSGIWASSQLFENTLLGVVGPQGWVDLFTGKMSWDDPKVKQAMTYFAKMRDYINPDHAKLTWDQAVKELMDGKVAFNSMGDWADGEFIKAHLKENVDFGWVNHPGTGGAFLIVADGFTLAKGAPHKEAAIAWLKSIGSKEAQEAFNTLKGSIPARTDVDKSQFDRYHQWSMGEFAKDKLLPSCVHGEAAPEAFQKALNDAVSAFVIDRNVDNFANALVLEAKKVGPIPAGRLEFGSQTIELVNPAVPPDAPAGYADDVHGAAKLNIIFHFRSGSTQLDNRAQADLNHLVDLLHNSTYQGRKILLFGFSDNYGGNRRNLRISKGRAQAVAAQLQSRGLVPALVTGYGKALPIAPNESEEGREQNRRVEVWLRSGQ
ncbi:MAG: extracellular solute-binding protein [Verrucomicrobia bacterium]|nr:extracellular solute-binding protein [Verrucomicrobiota bacterium]